MIIENNSFFQLILVLGMDSKSPGANKMRVADGPDCRQPRSAHTRLLVLERGVYEDYPATKVLLKPTTGRRHQLRVHTSFLGHTIIGDVVYSNGKDLLPHRMFLHAHRIILPSAVEHLDLTAGDPFSTDSLHHWFPQQTANPLNQSCYTKIDNSPASLKVTASSQNSTPTKMLHQNIILCQ